MAMLWEGRNLLQQSIGIKDGHWCPDWDFMYINEYSIEYLGCASTDKVDYKGPEV